MNRMFVIVLLAVVAAVAACSSGGSGGSSISFTGSAVESLPQLTTASATSSSSHVRAALASEYNTLLQFFEQECFMPDGDNYCPTGVDTSGGDQNPRKFTISTLLGLIYHAEMYSGGQQTTCQHTAATIGAGSFVAHTAENSDPGRFILDYFSLLSCLYNNADPGNTEGTHHQAYSVDSTGSYQATLTSRYRVPYNGVADPGQTDIFQVYVSLTDSTPQFLAFNFAGANTMYSRALVLADLVNHKFIAKYLAPGNSTQKIVAIGVGGVDRSTGTPNPGYYYANFTDNQGALVEKCVNNSDGAIGDTMDSCTSASVPISWTSSDDVKAYLGISATDAERVAAWLTLLADNNPLADATSPTNATQGGDPELYFPETIQAQ